MQPDLPTLLLADLVLTAGVALLMAAWGLLHAMPRGHWGWVAAPALAAAGAALQLAGEESRLLAGLGLWLLSLWPLAALQGLRRFDARQRLPGSAGGDALLAGLAALWALGLEFEEGPQRDAHAAVLAAALQACVALVLARAQAHRHSFVLRISALTLATGATLQGLAAWLALQAQAWAAPAALMLNALLAMAASGVAALLAHERAESALRESRRRLRMLGRRELLAPGSAHFEVLARRLLRRETRPSAVLLFDIDPHPQANQEEARVRARQRVVAHGVHATLRGHDLAGRHGDAFVLLLPGTTLRNAMAAAARIAERVQALALLEPPPPLSLSFGVGELRAGEDLAQGLHRARLALAEARRQGPGRAVSAAAGEREPVFVESRRLGARDPWPLGATAPRSARAGG
ncbi:diguanylate cyclase domain-containing protein [Azohydromonas caseinilytica]|uniref:diguanylate cyclase n=1 Tax=Azohydromonas caseinilytica TaxID=2728836 RepID=A0A848F803_9BURK|nr:diguanylate cyclase [Azohydromonas caseinilytica]NML14380.1 diguanylate cyclase [Azohydromonas caseinilytica]